MERSPSAFLTLGFLGFGSTGVSQGAGETSALVNGSARDESPLPWAFTSPRRWDPPVASDESWVSSDVDRFIFPRIEAAGIRPARVADRTTWLRRVSMDLTGLPPAPEETLQFLGDGGNDAQAKVVDRLLASPRFGEQWARHWLDVVRYADSFDARLFNPDSQHMDATEAWRYRDWVVDAFNRDLPYDEFVTHQIAGDLLCEEGERFHPERIVATGMLAIGNWGGGDSDKEKLLTDIADDQVDVVSRAFLGLTVACARCHDHKFDPITTQDYYGLAGMFFSSHILENVGPKTNGPPMLRIQLLSAREKLERESWQARLKEIDRRLKELVPSAGRALCTRVLNLGGIQGLHAWKNENDLPSATVNTTDRPISWSTAVIPVRSVCVHPSQSAGVAVAFRVPDSGELEVTGSIADADGVCGDGVEWRLEVVRGGEIDLLGSGSVDNGGAAQALTISVASTGRSSVRQGDQVRLLVLQRSEYTCDTTAVALSVRLRDSAGEQVLELSADVIESSNDAAAADGWLKGRWRFLDLGDLSADALTGEALGRVEALSPGRREEVVALLAEREGLERSILQPVAYANGVQEGGVPGSPHAGVHDVAVHHRGRYDQLGAVVARGFPKALCKETAIQGVPGSGRLELARWITNPDHPLTARVLVNRVWQQLFGEGLVRTPGNFGAQGEPPTHPELLDFLAVRFVQEGWSIKKLVRSLVLSSTYRQSSVADQATLEVDPDNRLVSRVNRRALSAEQLRDAMLFAAGILEETRGGPAVRDARSPRRTLYLMTVRSDRSTYRELFDAADPTAIVDERTPSIVAPQALYLLNAPWALEVAGAIANRVLSEVEGDQGAWIERLYQLLYARSPSAEEIEIGRIQLQKSADPRTVLADYAHLLLCTNELGFVD